MRGVRSPTTANGEVGTHSRLRTEQGRLQPSKQSCDAFLAPNTEYGLEAIAAFESVCVCVCSLHNTRTKTPLIRTSDTDEYFGSLSMFTARRARIKSKGKVRIVAVMPDIEPAKK